MGSKEVEFQIVEKGETGETIEITSKSEMRLAYTAVERLAVELTTNVNYRNLTAEIVSETEGWLTYTIARPTEGGAETDVTAYFSMAQNDGETPREATVTIKGVKNGTAVLKVTQLPKSKIEPEKLAYFLDVEAQTLDIPVTANVEFDVTVSEGATGWFTYNNADDSGLHFTVEALVNGSARSCDVVLTEKNAPDNAEALAVNINITQKPKGLIECVADMRRSRCYFPFLKNGGALNSLKNGTMEALVNIQETRVSGSLSTIMGVEGKFLLRLGDVNVPWNQIQLAMQGGNRTDTKLKLSELDRWYHVAVTWDDTFAYFYIDGELLYRTGISNYSGFNLGVAYGGSESDYNRAFWIGYAYNADRFFPGYMAEVRVWNRTLTKEEINAENHFYSVPVDSEGLVGYWKLNDGAGQIIKDHSPSGNSMLGEINVHSSGGQQIGDPGMNWVGKNIGMGCGSRAGKMEQHNSGKPFVKQKLCVGCHACAKICAHGAPTFGPDNKATIDTDKCVGCARCLAVCPKDAIQCMYDEAPSILNYKIAEYTKAVVDGRPCFHVSLVMDVSPNCDCHGENDVPIVPNVGMFASFDPVALDQACIDAVLAQPKMPNSVIGSGEACQCEDHFKAAHPDTDWEAALIHSEKIGLGSREYELVKI